ncbi:MAG: hypothetical protein RLY97_467 [Pseudomonadota bacterium]
MKLAFAHSAKPKARKPVAVKGGQPLSIAPQSTLIQPKRFAELRLIALLAVFALITGLVMVRVNAVKSQVQLAERQILELKRDKQSLETEFETRANQQQLADLNRMDFGYNAPEAQQYVDSERQLAAYGMERASDSPPMIRMARLDGQLTTARTDFPAMVSPVSGKLIGESPSQTQSKAKGEATSEIGANDLTERLSRVQQGSAKLGKQPHSGKPSAGGA